MSQLVLVVDDSRTMRDMVRMVLVQADYEVVQAVDGAHGLEVLSQHTPDVIITDINMPILDGFGFIEAVRSEDRTTPILVLTTESDDAKKQRARSAGASGWIVKPFDPDKLVGAVRRVAA